MTSECGRNRHSNRVKTVVLRGSKTTKNPEEFQGLATIMPIVI